MKRTSAQISLLSTNYSVVVFLCSICSSLFFSFLYPHSGQICLMFLFLHSTCFHPLQYCFHLLSLVKFRSTTVSFPSLPPCNSPLIQLNTPSILLVPFLFLVVTTSRLTARFVCWITDEMQRILFSALSWPFQLDPYWCALLRLRALTMNVVDYQGPFISKDSRMPSEV